MLTVRVMAKIFPLYNCLELSLPLQKWCKNRINRVQNVQYGIYKEYLTCSMTSYCMYIYVSPFIILMKLVKWFDLCHDNEKGDAKD